MTDKSLTAEKPRSLLTKVADRYGVEPDKMMTTLKATAFKGNVSNEQMMALLIVADQYGLNPWTKEIYAFPDKGGIVPVVGVDGWARIINSHPQFDGMAFEQDSESCTCTIYRKDRNHPVSVTEYMSECRRNTAPWASHPRRMLRHKAMIQCGRVAFGFAGIYDPDEADRMVVESRRSTKRTSLKDIVDAEEAEFTDETPVSTEYEARATVLVDYDAPQPASEPEPSVEAEHVPDRPSEETAPESPPAKPEPAVAKRPQTVEVVSALSKCSNIAHLEALMTTAEKRYAAAGADVPRPVTAAYETRMKQLEQSK